MDANPIGWACVFVAVFLGAAAQATTGFGIGLTTLPVLAAVDPGFVPAGVILLGLPLSAGNAVVDRVHLNLKAVVSIASYRFLGIGAGIAVLVAMSAQELQVACLAIALLSLASFADLRVLAWMDWWPAAGVLSGFMGAVTGVGGPPLAVAFRHLPLAQIRATTGLVTLIGATFTLLALVASGLLTQAHLVFALTASPIMLIAVTAGRRLVLQYANRQSRLVTGMMVAAGCLVLTVQVIAAG
jgi:uncharacterized membrane protein YfcA